MRAYSELLATPRLDSVRNLPMTVISARNRSWTLLSVNTLTLVLFRLEQIERQSNAVEHAAHALADFWRHVPCKQVHRQRVDDRDVALEDIVVPRADTLQHLRNDRRPCADVARLRLGIERDVAFEYIDAEPDEANKSTMCRTALAPSATLACCTKATHGKKA